MKKSNMFKNVLFASLAAALIVSAGLGRAWAYFTTYARAEGGYPISFKYDTDIEEHLTDWTKHVVIKNKEGSQPVYVRAKAFCGDAYSLTYQGTGWSDKEDGYYYYKDILYGGNDTSELLIEIGNIPTDVTEATLNVVVIYEYTPVKYDQTGKPYADWSKGGNVK